MIRKQLVDEEQCLAVYSDTGIDLNKPVIGMCTGGMSSCSLVLTAFMCGCPDTALFLVSIRVKRWLFTLKEKQLKAFISKCDLKFTLATYYISYILIISYLMPGNFT